MPVKLSRVAGEPYLRVSENGTFYVYCYPKKSKRKLVKSLNTKDVTEAHTMALEHVLAFNAENGVFGKQTRFKDIANEILAKYKANPNRRTYKVSLAPVRRLCETFENSALITLVPSDWEKHLNRMKAERPNLNLNSDRKIFVQVMRRAYQRGLVKLPPIGIPKPNPYQHVGREITKDEEARIMKYADKRIRFQIFISIQTGMRLQEMLRLRWDQVDLEGGFISLGNETKTSKPRRFAISQVIVTELRKRISNSTLVFPSPTNPEKPMRDNKFLWQRALKKARVNCRWHDLRHTCASRKVRAGIPVETVSKELGMSIQTLQRIYCHINDDDLRRSAEIVAERFLELEEE